jgi:hypothetical protein
MGGLYEYIAYQVLKDSKTYLSVRQIIIKACELGLLNNIKGKKPVLSMCSFLYRDVKNKHSLFYKIKSGSFILKENAEYIEKTYDNFDNLNVEEHMDIVANNFIEMDKLLNSEDLKHMDMVANNFIKMDKVVNVKFVSMNDLSKNYGQIKF